MDMKQAECMTFLEAMQRAQAGMLESAAEQDKAVQTALDDSGAAMGLCQTDILEGADRRLTDAADAATSWLAENARAVDSMALLGVEVQDGELPHRKELPVVLRALRMAWKERRSLDESSRQQEVEDLVAKLTAETRARQEAREYAGMLEPWQIPVPSIDHNTDLAENSATSADASVHLEASTKTTLNAEIGAGGVARRVTVAMMSGEEMELLVQPGETVHALAKRLSLIKGVGQVSLLVDHTPLRGNLFVLDCVPHTCVVTAIFQAGLDLPNRLDPIVEQQIRISCEMHNNYRLRRINVFEVADFWKAAFEKPTWQEFVEHIGTQDFQIRVFYFGPNPLNQTRYIDYNYGLGDNGFGSVHVDGESRATASCVDGSFELLVNAPRGFPSDEFEEDLAAAAHAKDGSVEEYGAW
jgi:hypothetical protein